MKIGLWSDAVNFPSLPLMKISAYHKLRGDTVTLIQNPDERYDAVYCSKTFNLPEIHKIPRLDFVPNADIVYYGGSGGAVTVINGKEVYNRDNDPPLPNGIEHIYPDYGLYPARNTALGFLTRGCPNNCAFCCVTAKEGCRSEQVAELPEFWRGQKEIKLLDPNLLACRGCERILETLILSNARIDYNQGIDARYITDDTAKLLLRAKISMIHFAFDLMKHESAVIRGLEIFSKYSRLTDRNQKVYILVNYDTTPAEDWYRVKKVIELGYHPDVRIYRKGTHTRFHTDLSRWANNNRLYRTCRFEDYIPRKSGISCGRLYPSLFNKGN
jgi:hypothetical protein